MAPPRRTRDVEIGTRRRSQRIIVNDRNTQTQYVYSRSAARRRRAGATAGPSRARRAAGLVGRIVNALGGNN